MDGNVGVEAVHKADDAVLALVRRGVGSVDNVGAIDVMRNDKRLTISLRSLFYEFQVGPREVGGGILSRAYAAAAAVRTESRIGY